MDTYSCRIILSGDRGHPRRRTRRTHSFGNIGDTNEPPELVSGTEGDYSEDENLPDLVTNLNR
jgi:hypothetical protein